MYTESISVKNPDIYKGNFSFQISSADHHYEKCIENQSFSETIRFLYGRKYKYIYKLIQAYPYFNNVSEGVTTIYECTFFLFLCEFKLLSENQMCRRLYEMADNEKIYWGHIVIFTFNV